MSYANYSKIISNAHFLLPNTRRLGNVHVHMTFTELIETSIQTVEGL